MTHLQKLNLEESGPNIYRSTCELPVFTSEHIAFLVSDSDRASRKRARICLHKSDDALVQEMLIAVQRSSYIRPHRHLGRSESMLALSGRALAVFFHGDDSISKTIELDGNAKTLYRIDTDVYHTLIPLTEHFVFKESTQGPFHRSTTEFAPWSPAPSDSSCQDWQDKLRARCHPAGDS